MVKKICRILFLFFIILFFFNIGKVKAYTTSYTGIDSVGASTINLTDIKWNEPDSISVTGKLKYMTNSSGDILIYWNRTSFESETKYTASYTLTYEDVGIDEDGNSIDISVYSYVTTINKYTSTVSWDSDDFLFCVASLKEDYIYARSQRETLNSSASFPHPAYVQSSQDFTVHIYKSGTTTEAEGNFLFFGENIDVYRDTGAYSEALKLTSGVNGKIYVDEDTLLSISSNKYTSTDNDADYDEQWALTCLMTSPFTFTWYGTNCRTELFVPFNSSSITSKIYTSTDGGSSYSLSYKGGSISATNTTTSGSNYSVLSQTSSTSKTIDTYWKNNYKYTTSSNSGYHLAKIVYDGTTSTSASSYTFSSVTSKHTFYAYYVANSYSVLFDGNGATSGETADMEDLYYDTSYTLTSNGYVKDGYTFLGWNTESDGSGTSYTDEESFSNLTTVDGDVITLYAQWAADTTVITYYIDINTNEELLEEDVQEGYVGLDYTTTKEDIDGYTYISSSDNTSGTMTEDTIYVYYYYAKDTTVVTKYIDVNTDEEILEEDTQEGYVGLEYTTTKEDIDGYTYISSSDNTSGTMTEDTIYVYYYYAKDTKVIVQYINLTSTTDEFDLLEQLTIEGYVGLEYETEEKEFDGYVLISTRGDLSGTMTEDTIRIYYYYAVSSKVVVTYVDNSSLETIYTYDIESYVGKSYEVTYEEQEGYILNEEKYPDNEEGKMTYDTIYVTYYLDKVMLPDDMWELPETGGTSIIPYVFVGITILTLGCLILKRKK